MATRIKNAKDLPGSARINLEGSFVRIRENPWQIEVNYE
jgi:hypothetical protein